MEESTTTSKTNLRINRCTYRRLNIEHELNEHLCLQTHLANLNSYKHQQQKFNQKLNYLRKSLAQIEPYAFEEINEEKSLMTPNCFSRIQNHFRLLNFSPNTEKRLLCQAPSYNKLSKFNPPSLPFISQKRNSKEVNQCLRRISFYQSRPPKIYSCRSSIIDYFSTADLTGEKKYQAYLQQQISDHVMQREKHNQRKTDLLNEFDQLKHKIDDPHSAFSVIAALSRALLFLDSGTE